MDNFFYSHLILIPVCAFLLSIFLKGLFVFISTGRIDLSRALGSGGMPSAHSAVVVSLATAIAIKYGVNSDLFAITMAFTGIIIYDALNVRFEAGLHASTINDFLGEKRFKESLGHLPSEAFAGSMLGVITAVILNLF
ncbi:MAG: divergent PAP2 family protein [Candidatus Gracilibacteria bacterium]|nr:divergent PAP2 family protein [Candidatus Gracilibacteria bacterium]MDQ7022827.1 divergent PAP2 family protein [Candidatus Gracilibacteria bacterium]